MSVTLRKRKNDDGSTSILLDIYHNGKRKYEFLKELKLVKPSSALHREENRQRLRLAEQIKNKREQLLQGDEYDVTPDFKKNIDFIRFFEEFLNTYKKKDKRILEGCLGRFRLFLEKEGFETITTREVSESLAKRFKEYLESNLNGETPSNYFKKFKKLLKHGVREKIFLRNPAEELTIFRSDGIKKDVLTAEEIQKLANTHLENEEVKRAFLFSCNTGLRFCDIKILKWEHIHGSQLKIEQQKTGVPVTVNLNKNAMFILSSHKRMPFVFSLPSHTACLKNLKTWCKNAGITKKITWHCARHSFATNIIFHGSDVNSVSSLLGHRTLTYTQRYLRVVESLKEKAVDNLPEINIAY
jgi:integrase/recombinase XerD